MHEFLHGLANDLKLRTLRSFKKILEMSGIKIKALAVAPQNYEKTDLKISQKNLIY